MHRATKTALALAFVLLAGSERASVAAFQAAPAPAAGDGKLVVFGDVVIFLGKPGVAPNCALQSRFKHGDPVGFRMTAIDPATGEREPSAQFVVHLTYSGMTQIFPCGTARPPHNPNVSSGSPKWVVPATAPTGIVRYTVTAKDKDGRTGEYKPFVVEDSQVTIVE